VGGVRRADDHGLVPVEDIARAVLAGGRLQVTDIVAALRLGIGEGEDGLAGDDLADQLVRAGGGAVLQEAAADDHRAEVGLDHEGFAQLFHDHHVLGVAAAEAAEGLREGRAEDAQLVSEGAPDLRPPVRLASQGRPALVEAVVIGQVARDGVAEHRLFFGEAEIHLCPARGRSPS